MGASWDPFDAEAPVLGRVPAKVSDASSATMTGKISLFFIVDTSFKV